jgi:hypothetical protein
LLLILPVFGRKGKMSNANCGEEELRKSVSKNEARAEWGGKAVVFGLVVEVVLTATYRHSESIIEAWGPVFADVLIALGVAAEILFARKARSKSETIQLRSAEKVAEANARASEANTRAAELQSESLKTQRAIMPRVAYASDRPEYLVLRKFAGVTVFIQAVPDWEALQFAKLISLALKNVGVDAQLVDESQTKRKPDTIQQGIKIFAERPPLAEITKKYGATFRQMDAVPDELRGYALTQRLKVYFESQGLAATAFTISKASTSELFEFNHPEPFVFILIGSKPLPTEWLMRGIGPGGILKHGDTGGDAIRTDTSHAVQGKGAKRKRP